MRQVEKLKSGRYKVRFRHGGTQTSETFDRHKDAVAFAKNLDAVGARRALDILYEAEQDKTIPTLDELAAEHIEHLTGVEPGTRKTYQRLWNRTWSKHIGGLRAHRIGVDDVRRAVNALGERYSRKSLENQRGLLAAVLDRAVEKEYLAKNPSKGIRLPRGDEAAVRDMRILTVAEFLTVEERIPAHYQPFVRFLWGTGCRWGEAVALTVEDVQIPNVRIRRALKWSPDNDRRVGSTKTRRSNRTVALPEPVQLDLEALTEGRARTDLVFTAPRGGAIHHRTFWSRVWLPAAEHLTPRPRLHDLRHSHASWLLGNGVPISVVQLRLGHESIKTTVDTYGHLLPDAQVAAARAAELAFMQERAIEPPPESSEPSDETPPMQP